MLRGTTIGLRSREPGDVATLHTQLHDDPTTRSRTDVHPWAPVPVARSSFAPRAEPDASVAVFSVVELGGDEPLAGSALLWGIDTHNRNAHLGLSLLPAFRGRGLAGDFVQVLCGYGFQFLGLRRLQIDTLGDNEPMIATALSAGFVHEGTLREHAWVEGHFLDEVVYGQLRDDWLARRSS